MKKQSYVSRLIHSLTRSEKRYFKLFANSWNKSDGKKWLSLYEAIRQEKTETEEGEKVHGQDRAVEKSKLATMILRGMRVFHAQHDPEAEIMDGIFNAKFLRSRKLYGQSLRELSKVESRARKLEKWQALLDANLVRRMVAKEAQKKDYAKELEQLRKERKEYLRLIAHEMEYIDLVDPLLVMIRADRNYQTEEEMQRAVGKDGMALLQNATRAETFSSRSNYNFSNYLYHQLLGQPVEAHAFQKALLQQWQDNVHIRETRQYRYKIVMTNYLMSCHSIGSYEEFPELIMKIRAITPKSLDEQAEDFQNLNYLELLYFMNTNQWQEALALEIPIDRGLKKFSDKVNPSRLHSFYHNLFVLHFYSGNLQKATKWIRKVPTPKSIPAGKDIQSFAILAEVMLTYEREGGLNEDTVRSVERRLAQRAELDGPEVLVVQFFKDLLKCQHLPQKARERFRKLSTGLKPHVDARVGIREIYHWALARGNDQPIKMVMPQGRLD